VTTQVVQPAVIAAPAQPDLKAVADALLNDVPKHLQCLIPQVTPAEQIEWYTKAKTAGAFTGAPAVPITDSGKPTVTPVEPNLNDLPPMARMSRGYGR
jgi:hypothetical protein